MSEWLALVVYCVSCSPVIDMCFSLARGSAVKFILMAVMPRSHHHKFKVEAMTCHWNELQLQATPTIKSPAHSTFSFSSHRSLGSNDRQTEALLSASLQCLSLLFDIAAVRENTLTTDPDHRHTPAQLLRAHEGPVLRLPPMACRLQQSNVDHHHRMIDDKA